MLVDSHCHLDRLDLVAHDGSLDAALDAARAAAEGAKLSVVRAEATLTRYDAVTLDEQPDVIVASRNVDAARSGDGRSAQRRGVERGGLQRIVGGL